MFLNWLYLFLTDLLTTGTIFFFWIIGSSKGRILFCECIETGNCVLIFYSLEFSCSSFDLLWESILSFLIEVSSLSVSTLASINLLDVLWYSTRWLEPPIDLYEILWWVPFLLDLFYFISNFVVFLLTLEFFFSFNCILKFVKVNLFEFEFQPDIELFRESPGSITYYSWKTTWLELIEFFSLDLLDWDFFFFLALFTNSFDRAIYTGCRCIYSYFEFCATSSGLNGGSIESSVLCCST